MTALLKNPDEKTDILGMLVILNPRCPFYETSFGGNGSGITALDVSGSLAGLPADIQRYAFLLGEGLKLERPVATDTTTKTYETRHNEDGKPYTVAIVEECKDAKKPEPHEFHIRSGDFYRVRNSLRRIVEREMIKSKVTPKTATLPQMAQHIAEGALKQRLIAKGHCSACDGRGWRIKIGAEVGTCDKCKGDGQARYSLEEKIDLAGLDISKQNFSKTWRRFDFFAVSELHIWDERIRDRLKFLRERLDHWVTI